MRPRNTNQSPHPTSNGRRLAGTLERQRWFRFLDRHHFIHHMDNTVNLNFLLPLCDLLFGTLRTHATEREQSKWPAFEEAKKLPDAT